MPSLLSINNYHYMRGGSDRVYLETAQMFRSAGWHTSFFSMHHPRNEATQWSKYFIDEIEFGHAYSVRQKLAMAAKVVYSFESQKKISALIRDHRPDIAHAHIVGHHISASVFPTVKRQGIPLVMTSHDLKVACPAYKMLSKGEICEKCKNGKTWNVALRACIKDSYPVSALIALESAVAKSLGLYRKWIDRMIVPSRFYEAKLAEWGFPREKIVYIPNYMDTDVACKTRAGTGILYFGRLAPEKGVSTLIAASRKANIPVLILGAGPEEDNLRRQAESLSAPVEFGGYRAGRDLWNAVEAARVVVIPSQWYENAPMSVLESFARGTPVIGADIGGIPELVRHGETGWLFESGNRVELATLLQQVQSASDDKILHMGRSASTFARNHFSRDRYRQALEKLYGELMTPARDRSG